MKVTVIRGGGIAGLVVMSAMDSRHLRTDVERGLRERVDRARQAMHASRPASLPSPDAVSVRVEIHDDAGQVQVANVVAGAPPELQDLIHYVTTCSAREEQVLPPG